MIKAEITFLHSVTDILSIFFMSNKHDLGPGTLETLSMFFFRWCFILLYYKYNNFLTQHYNAKYLIICPRKKYSNANTKHSTRSL